MGEEYWLVVALFHKNQQTKLTWDKKKRIFFSIPSLTKYSEDKKQSRSTGPALGAHDPANHNKFCFII